MNGYCCSAGAGGYLVIFLVFSKGYTQNVIIPMIADGEIWTYDKKKGKNNFDSALFSHAFRQQHTLYGAQTVCTSEIYWME